MDKTAAKRKPNKGASGAPTPAAAKTKNLRKMLQEELEARIKRVGPKIQRLLDAEDLFMGAVPFITNDGRLGARPQLQLKPDEGGN